MAGFTLQVHVNNANALATEDIHDLLDKERILRPVARQVYKFVI